MLTKTPHIEGWTGTEREQWRVTDEFIESCKPETFNPQWLLEALNAKRPEDWGRFWIENAPEHPPALRAFRKRTEEITRLQRHYVDLWLDTGRTADGVETPADRGPTWGIHHIVSGFVLSHSAESLPTKDGFSISILGQATCLARVGPDEYLACTPDEAARCMFVALLVGDHRLRIAKCRNADCGVYFFLGQWNRTYKNGTFCEICKRRRSLSSAKRAVVRSRLNAERELHGHAAQKFAKQVFSDEGWHRNADLKSTIADYLNAQIAKSAKLAVIYPRGITGKWVARSDNWTAIQEAVSGKQRKRGAKHNVTRKAR